MPRTYKPTKQVLSGEQLAEISKVFTCLDVLALYKKLRVTKLAVLAGYDRWDGICHALKELNCSSRVKHISSELAAYWPKHSGSYKYPVPASKAYIPKICSHFEKSSLTKQQLAYSYTDLKDKFSLSNSYGKNRRELLNFLIAACEQLLALNYYGWQNRAVKKEIEAEIKESCRLFLASKNFTPIKSAPIASSKNS